MFSLDEEPAAAGLPEKMDPNGADTGGWANALLLFSVFFFRSGASMLTLRLCMRCLLRTSADASLLSESSGDAGLQLATIYEHAVPCQPVMFCISASHKAFPCGR